MKLQQLKVIKGFSLPSGRKFKKGEIYLGHYNYFYNLDLVRDKPSSLIIVLTKECPFLLNKKDCFEIVI